MDDGCSRRPRDGRCRGALSSAAVSRCRSSLPAGQWTKHVTRQSGYSSEPWRRHSCKSEAFAAPRNSGAEIVVLARKTQEEARWGTRQTARSSSACPGLAGAAWQVPAVRPCRLPLRGGTGCVRGTLMSRDRKRGCRTALATALFSTRPAPPRVEICEPRIKLRI
jgi:hypothetical protein